MLMMVRQARKKVREVSLVRRGRHVEFHFDYDPKIVTVMRRYKGWFRSSPTRHWQFKPEMEKEVINELKAKGYRVRVFTEKDKAEKSVPKKKRKEPDPFADKDVLAVLGYCKKCKEYTWINKEKICVRCK